MKPILNEHGQATVEYIFILAFAILFGLNVANRYSGFFSDAFGHVSHVLSTNLTVGVCSTECWYNGYYNAYKGSGTP